MKYRDCKACGDIQNQTSVCGGCMNQEKRDQQGVVEEQEKYEQEIINENN